MKPKSFDLNHSIYRRATLAASGVRVFILNSPGTSNMDEKPFRLEVVAAWQQRLDRALSRYKEKVAIRKQMVVERKVWPINLAPDPALHLALQEESAARTEYIRLLRIYNELILHGTPPDEDLGS